MPSVITLSNYLTLISVPQFLSLLPKRIMKIYCIQIWCLAYLLEEGLFNTKDINFQPYFRSILPQEMSHGFRHSQFSFAPLRTAPIIQPIGSNEAAPMSPASHPSLPFCFVPSFTSVPFPLLKAHSISSTVRLNFEPIRLFSAQNGGLPYLCSHHTFHSPSSQYL